MEAMGRLIRSRRAQVGLALAVCAALAGAGWLALSAPTGSAPGSTPTAAARPTGTPLPSATATATASASPTSTPSAAAYCPWNGLPLTDVGAVTSTAIALQIENHPQARPARNLSRADMVIEATVEGDVTRFTAVFQCEPTQGLTGPIRSARYYSVDLWQDLGVLPVGFGASFEALDRYTQFGMPYVNGITGAWPWFRRYGTSAAPHNLYGDIEALRAAFGQNAALDRLASRVHAPRPQFTFSAEPMRTDGRPVATLEIRTNSYWRFGWTYDRISGLWQRQDAGAPVVDALTDQPLTARTVVVQRVTEDVVFGDPDPAGNPRRLHHLVGSGNGTIYVDGVAFDVRWSRPTAADGTVWTYADTGDRVILRPGIIWWEIVPTVGTVTEVPPG